MVLESEETYCCAKALFEPVMKLLSDLPSPESYFQLNEWKPIVTAGLKKLLVSTSDTKTTSTDESDSGEPFDDEEREMNCGSSENSETEMSDASTTVDPDDTMDAMSVLRDLEHGTNCFQVGALTSSLTDNDILSQTSPPTLRLSESSQSIIFGDEASKVAPMTATSEVNITAAPNKGSKPPCEVNVLRVPRPKLRTNDHRRAKQKHPGKLPQKFAVIPLPAGEIPNLPRVANWAQWTHELRHVLEMLDKYPVIMSDDFMKGRVDTCTHELI